MIFPAARRALRWLPRPGARALTRAAMEVALRGVRKVLCVAEKNDAAKGIADLLSGGRMRRVRRSPGGRDRDERPLLPPGVPCCPAGRPGACCDPRAFRNGVSVSSLFRDLARRRVPSRSETRNRRPNSPSLPWNLRGRPSGCIRRGDPPKPLSRRARWRSDLFWTTGGVKERVKRFGKGVTGGLTSCSRRSQLQK